LIRDVCDQIAIAREIERSDIEAVSKLVIALRVRDAAEQIRGKRRRDEQPK
jgi:hypothetical protein